MATSLALAASEQFRTVLLDCDVEAPNAALFLKPVVAKIPYDDAVTWAMIRGMTVTELGDGVVATQIRRVWDEVCQVVNHQENGPVQARSVGV